MNKIFFLFVCVFQFSSEYSHAMFKNNMVSEEDPDSYTLVALDKNLELGQSSAAPSSRPEFKDIAPFLNPTIWQNDALFDSSKEGRSIEVVEKEDYYVVRMMKSATSTKAERLVTRLMGQEERGKEAVTFQSSLLFFPQKNWERVILIGC